MLEPFKTPLKRRTLSLKRGRKYFGLTTRDLTSDFIAPPGKIFLMSAGIVPWKRILKNTDGINQPAIIFLELGWIVRRVFSYLCFQLLFVRHSSRSPIELIFEFLRNVTIFHFVSETGRGTIGKISGREMEKSRGKMTPFSGL